MQPTKRSLRLTFSQFAVGLIVLSPFVRGDDWPQWRGPQRDGISHETGLLKEWPKDGPKLIWQAKEIGSGFSTPAVVAGRLYLLGNDGVEKEFVSALSVSDGKPIWSTPIGKVGNPNQQPAYPAARSTTTVDGDALYALGSDGDLVCLETASGKIRWQKSLRADFGGQPGIWAYSESPLIDGDAVICTPGGADSTLLALNKKTGEVIWKSAIPGAEQASYSSPIIMNVGDLKQYVQFIQKGLVGVDAKTGKLLWRYDKTAQGSPANIPTPVAHDGYVYSASGRGGGGLIKLKGNQGVFEAEQIYHNPKLPMAIGGSVLVGGYMYGTTGQSLLCVEYGTGNIKWENRAIGTGSICFADGRLYIHGENGEVAMVEATPDGYQEKGRFTPAGGPARGNSKAWAYPILADGKLYIRDLSSLWCYDVKNSR